MEKTYQNCGLSKEQIANILTGMIKDLILSLDIGKLIEDTRKKYPTVTEEQWEIILGDDYDHFPRTEEEVDQMMNDLGVKDLYMSVYDTDREDPEEPAEE